MEENTNSTETVDGGLFDDAAAETTEEQIEETDSGEAAEDTTEEAETEQTVRIRYNGEEIEVPMSEAVTLAQKGKNYDKLKERYDALNNGEELKLVRRLAKDSGMTVAEYVAHAQEQEHASIVDAELKSLMDADPDIDPALARELAEARAAKKTATRKTRAHDAELKPWDDFVATYPEMGTDVSKLPDEVQDAIAGGESPVSAMRAYELAQERKRSADLQKQLDAARKNTENKRKTTGSARTTGKAEADPFLEGFKL